MHVVITTLQSALLWDDQDTMTLAHELLEVVGDGLEDASDEAMVACAKLQKRLTELEESEGIDAEALENAQEDAIASNDDEDDDDDTDVKHEEEEIDPLEEIDL